MSWLLHSSSGLSKWMICMVKLSLEFGRWIIMSPQASQSLSWARKHSFCFSDISPSVRSHRFIFRCSSHDSLTVFSRKTLAYCSTSKVSTICLIYHLFACLHNRLSFPALITQIVSEIRERLCHLLWSWRDHYLIIMDVRQAGIDIWLAVLGMCPGDIRDH